MTNLAFELHHPDPYRTDWEGKKYDDTLHIVSWSIGTAITLTHKRTVNDGLTSQPHRSLVALT